MRRMLMMATTAAMIEQFNKNNILILKEMGYEVHVLGNFIEGNPISDERLEEFKVWIIQQQGKWFHYSATRKPADVKNNLKAYKFTLKLINKYHYEFIHCHTPIGSVIARMAAYKTSTKIIYTAHGFHFYTGAPLKNWLLFYPIEKLFSCWTDVLITINTEDYRRAKESLYAKKIIYIPGVGVDTDKFKPGLIDVNKKRAEFGLQETDIMLLSVGELNWQKNHEVVIRALYKLKKPYVKYFICGKGERELYLSNLIQKLDMNNQIVLLGYRTDISELCQVADLFVFPSRREGLSVALMEAMSCGLPCIASDIRGNRDLLEHNRAFLFFPEDENDLKEKIENILKDVALRNKCSKYNRQKMDSFSLEKIQKEMTSIYEQITIKPN